MNAKYNKREVYTTIDKNNIEKNIESIEEVNERIDNLPQPSGGITMVEVLGRTDSTTVKISADDYDDIAENYKNGKSYRVYSPQWGVFGDIVVGINPNTNEIVLKVYDMTVYGTIITIEK